MKFAKILFLVSLSVLFLCASSFLVYQLYSKISQDAASSAASATTFASSSASTSGTSAEAEEEIFIPYEASDILLVSVGKPYERTSNDDGFSENIANYEDLVDRNLVEKGFYPIIVPVTVQNPTYHDYSIYAVLECYDDQSVLVAEKQTGEYLCLAQGAFSFNIHAQRAADYSVKIFIADQY